MNPFLALADVLQVVNGNNGTMSEENEVLIVRVRLYGKYFVVQTIQNSIFEIQFRFRSHLKIFIHVSFSTELGA
jgi:hypothetical protein